MANRSGRSLLSKRRSTQKRSVARSTPSSGSSLIAKREASARTRTGGTGYGGGSSARTTTTTTTVKAAPSQTTITQTATKTPVKKDFVQMATQPYGEATRTQLATTQPIRYSTTGVYSGGQRLGGREYRSTYYQPYGEGSKQTRKETYAISPKIIPSTATQQSSAGGMSISPEKRKQDFITSARQPYGSATRTGYEGDFSRPSYKGTGFEGRVREYQLAEAGAARRMQTYKDYFIPPQFKGDSWGGRFVGTIATAPYAASIGFGEQLALKAKAGGLAWEAMKYRETRPLAQKEVKRAIVDVPKEAGKAFDPRKPEGLANILLVGATIKVIGQSRTTARAITPKTGTAKPFRYYQYEKAGKIRIVEKGTYKSVSGKQMRYDVRTTLPKTKTGVKAKGEYTLRIKDTGGKLIRTDKGTVTTKATIKPRNIIDKRTSEVMVRDLGDKQGIIQTKKSDYVVPMKKTTRTYTTKRPYDRSYIYEQQTRIKPARRFAIETQRTGKITDIPKRTRVDISLTGGTKGIKPSISRADRIIQFQQRRTQGLRIKAEKGTQFYKVQQQGKTTLGKGIKTELIPQKRVFKFRPIRGKKGQIAVGRGEGIGRWEGNFADFIMGRSPAKTAPIGQSIPKTIKGLGGVSRIRPIAPTLIGTQGIAGAPSLVIPPALSLPKSQLQLGSTAGLKAVTEPVTKEEAIADTTPIDQALPKEDIGVGEDIIDVPDTVTDTGVGGGTTGRSTTITRYIYEGGVPPPPPPPPPPTGKVIPSLLIGGGGGGLGLSRRGGRKTPFATKYLPSVEALVFNIKGKRPSKRKVQTGLFLRPLS